MEPDGISAGDPLVIDCGVAINLAATGRAFEIAKAIPNRLIVERTVQRELENSRQQSCSYALVFAELVTAGLLEIVEMAEEALVFFEGLVVGDAHSTLDDSEAATIAYAAEQGLRAAIDEEKAEIICAQRFPSLKICSTGDLLALPSVERAIGKRALSAAVLESLRGARMRVASHREQWVVDLIGADEAVLCKSLSRAARALARSALGR